MNSIFGKWFKNYNDFSKGDRNAIIILGGFILVIIIGIVIIDNIQPKSKYDHSEYRQLLLELEASKSNLYQSGKSLFVFDPNTIDSETLDSLDLPEFIKRNLTNYRNAGGKFSSPYDIRKIYGMTDSIFSVIEDYINISEKTDRFANIVKIERKLKGFFDPNIADFNQFMEFGFNRFQANNIIEYRKRDGFFKTKTDLLKIYGIDSAFYYSIENHITIEIAEKATTLSYKPELLQIELNSADSIDLVKLNGVGSVYAARIIKYRNLLGGFYSASQLLEVYNFTVETYSNIENSISVDTLLIKKIRLNFAEYADLLRHPYLNKKQIEAVLNYRDKNGSFQNISQLKTNGLIDSETFSRISPYLTCR